MTVANSEFVYGKSALRDQAKRAAHSGGSAHPRRGTRGSIRPAAFAGTKSVRFGSGCARIKADVFSQRGAGWANGTAVDFGGEDSDEELTVKARVTRGGCLKAGFSIQVHDLRIAGIKVED